MNLPKIRCEAEGPYARPSHALRLRPRVIGTRRERGRGYLQTFGGRIRHFPRREGIQVSNLMNLAVCMSTRSAAAPCNRSAWSNDWMCSRSFAVASSVKGSHCTTHHWRGADDAHRAFEHLEPAAILQHEPLRGLLRRGKVGKARRRIIRVGTAGTPPVGRCPTASVAIRVRKAVPFPETLSAATAPGLPPLVPERT